MGLCAHGQKVLGHVGPAACSCAPALRNAASCVAAGFFLLLLSNQAMRGLNAVFAITDLGLVNSMAAGSEADCS